MVKENEILNQLDPDTLINNALELGASYADFRFQLFNNEFLRVENRVLEDYTSRNFGGYGLRVIVDGAIGYSSSSNFEKKAAKDVIKSAFKSANSFKSKRGILADTKPAIFNEKVKIKKDPFSVSPEEKVKLLMELNKTGWISDEVKNVITILGSSRDYRFFQSSEGAKATVEVPSIGIAYAVAALVNGNMEFLFDQLGDCSGYEYIEKNDWNKFAIEQANLAIKTAGAKAPSAGTYPVVIDPELVGILVHEAFGHAAEADLVFTGASALKDRLGEQLADEQVTVIDEGIVDGGYFIPFDDEGVKKGKTVVLENGILKSYMHDRNSAKELNVEPTGNYRAQDFENQPQVRMTNTYIGNGSYSFDELLEGVDNGLYIKRRGSTGGQVEVGMGTFTFNGGESFAIRNGELAEQVKGVVLSGAFLENLKTVDAVGNDLSITAGYFGACGKGGQQAKVGVGGPHIRIREMTIGGK
ncbi:MAG: TldD/PmbA family protein [Candidatus Thorarchaeota archaeon]